MHQIKTAINYDVDQQSIANRFLEFYYGKGSVTSGSSFCYQEKQHFKNLDNSFFVQPLSTSLFSSSTEMNDAFDTPFTMEEFKLALSSCKLSSSPGSDNIPYAFIVNLSEEALEILLGCYNMIWCNLDEPFPQTWKLVTVKPFLKPRKPKFDLSSYRPISLTSCPGKILEKMVNLRLQWLVDVNSAKLTPNHFGFRRHLNSEDCLQHIALEAKFAKENKKHMLFLNMDLKDAYPSTSHALILHQLASCYLLLNSHDSKDNSRMFSYVRRFLEGNQVQVSCNGHLSQARSLEGVGIPQGSILSPILFRIAITGLEYLAHVSGRNCKYENVQTQILVYADDIFLKVTDADLDIAKSVLEDLVKSVLEFLKDRLLQVAIDKLALIHLVKPRSFLSRHKEQQNQKHNVTTTSSSVSNGEVGDFNDSEEDNNENILSINITSTSLLSKTLHAVDSHCILGVFLNSNNLNFEKHFNYVKSQCGTWQNMLKCLSGSPIHARPHILLNVYRNAIRPRIEYGSAAYATTASRTNLTKLETIQNTCLRIATGAFSTTPVSHLQQQAYIPSLAVRRTTRITKTLAKQIMMQNNHPSFALYYDQLLSEDFGCVSSYNSRILERWHPNPIPPWKLKVPSINVDLHHLHSTTNKRGVLPLEYRMRFNELRHTLLPEYHFIFTDGSQQQQQSNISTTYALYDATTDNVIEAMKLPSAYSVFSSELFAIRQALSYIVSNCTMVFEDRRHYCIATDCLSVCNLLANPKTLLQSECEITRDIFILHNKLLVEKGISLIFLWVPSHVGIKGNELADKFAKEAHNNFRLLYASHTNTPLPYIDFVSSLRRRQNEVMVSSWKRASDERSVVSGPSFLFTRQQQYSKRVTTFDRFPRYKQVVIGRLRMEHTWTTHQYLFDKDSSLNSRLCPVCKDSSFIYTVLHILEECPVTLNIRQIFDISIRSLFGTANDANILINFLMDTNQFYDI